MLDKFLNQSEKNKFYFDDFNIDFKKDRLCETDEHLSRVYVDLFDTIIKKVGDFGCIKPNESEIEIISNLQHRELLKDNTTVVYKHDEVYLYIDTCTLH